MIKVENTTLINKPVEEVFAFVTTEGNYTKWQAGVMEAIQAEGPRNVVGSRFSEVRKFMGQEMRTTLEITAFALNAKWAAKVVKGPVPYEVTVTYEPSNGGTKMVTRVEGEPTGFFKLAEGMVANQLKKNLAEDGQKLKELLEKN
jgi:uncharacterized protein YndB with AHSA1/START domain